MAAEELAALVNKLARVFLIFFKFNEAWSSRLNCLALFIVTARYFERGRD